MVVFNVHQIPRFEGLRLSTLGGVREHTDIHTHTDRQTTPVFPTPTITIHSVNEND